MAGTHHPTAHLARICPWPASAPGCRRFAPEIEFPVGEGNLVWLGQVRAAACPPDRQQGSAVLHRAISCGAAGWLLHCDRIIGVPPFQTVGIRLHTTHETWPPLGPGPTPRSRRARRGILVTSRAPHRATTSRNGRAGIEQVRHPLPGEHLPARHSGRSRARGPPPAAAQLGRGLLDGHATASKCGALFARASVRACQEAVDCNLTRPSSPSGPHHRRAIGAAASTHYRPRSAGAPPRPKKAGATLPERDAASASFRLCRPSLAPPRHRPHPHRAVGPRRRPPRHTPRASGKARPPTPDPPLTASGEGQPCQHRIAQRPLGGRQLSLADQRRRRPVARHDRQRCRNTSPARGSRSRNPRGHRPARCARKSISNALICGGARHSGYSRQGRLPPTPPADPAPRISAKPPPSRMGVRTPWSGPQTTPPPGIQRHRPIRPAGHSPSARPPRRRAGPRNRSARPGLRHVARPRRPRSSRVSPGGTARKPPMRGAKPGRNQQQHTRVTACRAAHRSGSSLISLIPGSRKKLIADRISTSSPEEQQVPSARLSAVWIDVRGR